MEQAEGLIFGMSSWLAVKAHSITDHISGFIAEPFTMPVNVFTSKVAWAVIQLARRLPILSLLFFSNQWGPNIKNLYFIFAKEDYWVHRFLVNGGRPEIQTISLLLVQIFLARVDFMLRFILGFVYGNHWVGTTVAVPNGSAKGEGLDTEPLNHLPVAYSFVGLTGVKDGEVDTERGPEDNTAISFALTENCLAKQELLTFANLPGDISPTTQTSYPPIYLMAEAAWLAYEEARVTHSLLTNANFGWVVTPEREQVIVMEFVSVTYRYPNGVQKEQPLNTQLVLFKKGNAVILAFRGSQPVSFFDWFYNFTLASGHGGNSYAAMGTITASELSGYKAHVQTDLFARLLDLCRGSQGLDTEYVRLHEGFATDLGLELHPNGNPQAPGMTPTSFRVLVHAPQGFNSVKPIPQPDELQPPRIFDLPAQRAELLTELALAKDGQVGSPYAFVSSLIKHELDKDDNTHLYVTGHSLGGALASVFATKFASDATKPDKKRVTLVTFGEPLSGGQRYADIKYKEFVEDTERPRYARVVDLNDGVPRIPQYFPDTGERFRHTDGPGVVYFIDSAKTLQGGAALPLSDDREPKYQQLSFREWQGIKSGWQALAGYIIGDDATFQSSWRFFIRILLAPTGIFNDHLDYKAVLRTHSQRAENVAPLPANGHVPETELAAKLPNFASHVSA